ncbi:MAG: DUF3667 domain-containing protein [Pseudomonadota bacterium]
MTQQADPLPLRCLNCEAEIRGQYCGHCGQRARDRLISLWELLREGFGDLLDLDSRLWRTLIPLAVRPGTLTRDYLLGRRARYMPPFRMYLVLSLTFFLIAFFDPYDELGIFFEAPVGTPAAAPAASGTEAGGSAPPRGIDDDETRLDCSLDDYDSSDWPGWLAQRFTKERVQTACLNIAAADGAGWQGVRDRMIEHVPTGLFLLLPVMGLVLLALHPLSRRYYVEHLLFVIHYHSFVFLLLSVEVLFLHLSAALGLPDAINEATEFAATVYIPVYLYKSLRTVYAQRHVLTSVKFVVLCLCYAVGLALIVGISALIAAFSV